MIYKLQDGRHVIAFVRGDYDIEECKLSNYVMSALFDADEEFLNAISSGEIGAMKVELSELTVSFGKIAQELGGGRGGKRLFGGSKDIPAECETWPAPGENLHQR